MVTLNYIEFFIVCLVGSLLGNLIGKLIDSFKDPEKEIKTKPNDAEKHEFPHNDAQEIKKAIEWYYEWAAAREDDLR